ncbi:MAG: cytochrome c [Candidatus Sulfotelmatobacter sp.]
MKITFHTKTAVTVLLCALAIASASSVFAGPPSSPSSATPSSGKDPMAGTPVVHLTDADSMRVAGEQRFRANCGRCHNAPQKFPPRMMATILRHMRVRATITDEDRRLILFYMTQ